MMFDMLNRDANRAYNLQGRRIVSSVEWPEQERSEQSSVPTSIVRTLIQVQLT